MLPYAVVLTEAKFPLTIESIMRGPALVGHAPRGLRWSPDGAELRFTWAKADGTADPAYKPYLVKRDGTGLSPASGQPPLGASPLRPGESRSRAGDLEAYEKEGDIFLDDLAKKTTVQLTKTPEGEFNPKIAADGKSIVFLKGGNVYRITIEDKGITQLTDVKNDAAPASGAVPDPSADQPFGEPAPGLSPNGSGNSPMVVHVPAGYRASPLSLSPSGACASMELTMYPGSIKRTQVPSYITGSGAAELMSGYEKVGSPQPTSKMLLIDLNTGSSIDIAPPRPGRVSTIRWAPDGKHAVLWARSDDHKDDWMFGFDSETDKVTTIWDEHDDAWVGGPGRGVQGWLPDGSRFYFESEKNGYANLYSMNPTGGDVKPIVEGNFEVSDLRLDPERKRFTFVSSEGSPFKRHVDAVGFDGGQRRKLADLSADEDATYAVSPDGKDVAVVRSTSNRPPELFVNNVQVTHSPTEEWLAGPWIDPPIVMVPSTDGVQVPAHLYRPKNWRKGGPAVIFVHGAGYLQNVYDGWSYYYREYMFHHYLMSRGYTVLDLDYRASAGYGKAWRTAVYRHMGGKDLDDEVSGAKWLVKEQGVAADRIGIYGGSYGGFMTLMAMFTAPEVFAAGAALRPVSDWSNYNHPYTSDILNLPQNDKEAYRQSSPINFAEGLKGSLLICHGMVDTNVHFEDTVKLIQRLIDLGKRNWEVAPYPVEDHGFTKASSWKDEYTRISDLFDRTIGPDRKKK